MLGKLLTKFRPEPEPERPRQPSHAGGALYKYTEEEIDQHIPKLQMSYYDIERGKVLDEKQVTSARNAGILQPTFYNSMQDLDYLVLEGISKNVIVGTMLNTLTNFVTGGSCRPELELLNPTDDPAKDQKELEKHRKVIEELRAIERAIERDNDISFIDYIEAVIDNAITYGRGAIIVNSATSYKGIPTNYRQAHPRDLSITEFDAATWNLKSVLWRYGAPDMTPRRNLVYVWNPLATAKSWNTWQYGLSMALPMLAAARALRHVLAVDFPAMVRANYAGTFLLTVRPQGQDQASKEREYGDIVKRFTPGAPAALIEAPEDVDYHGIDYKPEYEQLTKLCEFLLKYCVSSLGLGSAQHYDEGDSNRSSSRTRIQVTLASTITPLRERFARMICKQTYQRWLEQLHPDLTDKVRVKMVFGEIAVSEPWDKLEYALRLDSRQALSQNALGKLIDHPDYANMVQPDAETHPGGIGEKPHNIARDNDGKNLDQGITKNKEGMVA